VLAVVSCSGGTPEPDQGATGQGPSAGGSGSASGTGHAAGSDCAVGGHGGADAGAGGIDGSGGGGAVDVDVGLVCPALTYCFLGGNLGLQQDGVCTVIAKDCTAQADDVSCFLDRPMGGICKGEVCCHTCTGWPDGSPCSYAGDVGACAKGRCCVDDGCFKFACGEVLP
jgi:hypothetical protein